MTDNLLHDNKWVSLREIVDLDLGIKGYVYSHETNCKGKKISILPYRIIGGELEFLMRLEMTPCWSTEFRYASTITGGVENAILEEDVLRELKEEGGYTVDPDDLIDLGGCFGIKSSDNWYRLYSVDVSKYEQGEAPGDGSELEKQGGTLWVNKKQAVFSSDPLAAVIVSRLDL